MCLVEFVEVNVFLLLTTELKKELFYTVCFLIFRAIRRQKIPIEFGRAVL
jgi:hypothetical protein